MMEDNLIAKNSKKTTRDEAGGFTISLWISNALMNLKS
jgi:hypothetical protein